MTYIPGGGVHMWSNRFRWSLAAVGVVLLLALLMGTDPGWLNGVWTLAVVAVIVTGVMALKERAEKKRAEKKLAEIARRRAKK
jgi:hypothetical protein